MAEGTAITSTTLNALPKIAEGKVRDLYEVDSNTLLFVASDRISAYDVIMSNGIPSKGPLLTQLSTFWFHLLPTLVPGLRTHFLTLSLPSQIPPSQIGQLENRSMQVRRLKVFPIEAIVRGYITGSAWKEYQRSQTVHGIPMPAGLLESSPFPQPLYTPSTKAEAGQNDENIHPSEAAKIVGEEYATQIEDLAIKLYTAARDYAAERGIIIADTKFEFGVDEAGDVVLVDEVLTPDSSRFWRKDRYEVGREQESFDKQFLRNWLVREGLKGKQGVSMPEEVVKETARKYKEAYEGLTGAKWENAVTGKDVQVRDR
ncbi:Phosphoribosylaminoimidazole-succinocarboxamide synthase [Hyphodiscus hymeniophilus]|uniref:Phosphoribosylaminoimidazole-succinocarboxamide synthase n=1 Tax=Hyphodiscus hymeniophilus TaxID=353542 RepID=A0A9P6VL09_9HELO|nr:Phosphoribosylaminoimidazole-succinocarboxamide synthase [Hyphodiscus hymeniophilus]